MAFIRTVSYEEAAEDIKEGYDAILRHDLYVPNVHAVSGIRPDIMETLATHTRTVMNGKSGLTKAEKEMVATVVSAVNKCQLSTIRCAEALHKQDPDSLLARRFGENYRDAGLSKKQVAMLEFAESLTVTPSTISRDCVDHLRGLGWLDEDIVDIVHITGLFNYLVRVMDGLGADLPLNRGREAMTNRLPFRDEIVLKTFGNIA